MIDPHADIAATADPERLPAGFALRHVGTVGSTNDELERLAEQGAAAGTILLADRQTAGRGRLGRVWLSAPGNLHASILLRPDCSLRNAPQLSLLAGVALADALAAQGPQGLDLTLKWPNDVLIGGAKVAGILLESRADGRGRLDHVILGVGVNIAWSPEGMDYPVTSLNAAGFAARSPAAWLLVFASSLALWLDRWRRDGFPEVRKAWCARSHALGEPIRLRLQDKEIDGRFVDLTERGALLIERADGSRCEMTAGDVVHAER